MPGPLRGHAEAAVLPDRTAELYHIVPDEKWRLSAAGPADGPCQCGDQAMAALSHLLRLRRDAIRTGLAQRNTLLLFPPCPAPFIIGIAGGVASGKTHFAHELQDAIGTWPDRPRVETVTTDAFLYDNATLTEKDRLSFKGFPDTYDAHGMIDFLIAARSGADAIPIPVYSHARYDLVPGATHRVARADILILEGINVLQTLPGGLPPVTDFLDAGVYLDASEQDAENWFIVRILALARAATQDSSSFYYRFSQWPESELRDMAAQGWRDTNLVNLRDHIAPSRTRAHIIWRKDSEHRLSEVWLRKN